MLADVINKESRIKREKTKEKLKKINTEQIEFLTKCENLAKQFIPIPEGANNNKPLNKAYHIFKSVVSNIQH